MWRSAVTAARTCAKPHASPPAPAECHETCSDPAHMLPVGTRFHDLRHFFASALIAANLNPKVIQARLGHATLAETMDTYGKSRVLHQPGEKPQVSRSRRCRNSVSDLRIAAVGPGMSLDTSLLML